MGTRSEAAISVLQSALRRVLHYASRSRVAIGEALGRATLAAASGLRNPLESGPGAEVEEVDNRSVRRRQMGITVQGPLAGLVVAAIGLYLLLAPIDRLARKPSALGRRRYAKQAVPAWMRVFFRALGLVLLALAGLLLAPLFRGA